MLTDEVARTKGWAFKVQLPAIVSTHWLQSSRVRGYAAFSGVLSRARIARK